LAYGAGADVIDMSKQDVLPEQTRTRDFGNDLASLRRHPIVFGALQRSQFQLAAAALTAV
jgi:hypothetical protein